MQGAPSRWISMDHLAPFTLSRGCGASLPNFLSRYRSMNSKAVNISHCLGDCVAPARLPCTVFLAWHIASTWNVGPPFRQSGRRRWDYLYSSGLDYNTEKHWNTTAKRLLQHRYLVQHDAVSRWHSSPIHGQRVLSMRWQRMLICSSAKARTMIP